MRIEFFLNNFNRNKLSPFDVYVTDNPATIRKLRPLLRELHRDRITAFKYGKYFYDAYVRFSTMNSIGGNKELTDIDRKHIFKVLYTKSIDCYHIIITE